jgi:hypothetical protein
VFKATEKTSPSANKLAAHFDPQVFNVGAPGGSGRLLRQLDRSDMDIIHTSPT